MPTQTREVRPTKKLREVRTPSGELLAVPLAWSLLSPGDAGLTRRVKAAGPCWTVKTQRRRRWVSLGVWAPADRIARLTAEREAEKVDPAYLRKLEAGRRRRAAAEQVYAKDFETAVLDYLDFDPHLSELAEIMAKAIAVHAVPVGSGTVARTKRIPIAQRAEAATIAWMRHQTTAYDDMVIPRVKGKRREVRRMLAQRSKSLLRQYRDGTIDLTRCPLKRALSPRSQHFAP